MYINVIPGVTTKKYTKRYTNKQQVNQYETFKKVQINPQKGRKKKTKASHKKQSGRHKPSHCNNDMKCT